MTEPEPKKEPVAQGLNYILNALDIIASMALQAENYDEVAAEEVRLSQIVNRAQLILSFIDARKTPSGLRKIRRSN